MSGINVKTTAGTELFISGTLPATNDKAGFDAIANFVKVTRVTNFGDLIQSYTPVEFNDVATRDTYTLKGTRNAAELSIQLGRVIDDAGQLAIKAAVDSDADFSFKIVTQDSTIFYFVGKVMSADLNLGDANTVTGNAVTVRLNSRVVEDIVGQLTLTYSAGANGTVVGELIQYVASGGSGTAVGAFPVNSVTHKFDKWSDDSTANPRTDTNVLADVTVTAQFVIV